MSSASEIFNITRNGSILICFFIYSRIINAETVEDCIQCFGNVGYEVNGENFFEFNSNSPKPEKIVGVTLRNGLVFFVFEYELFYTFIYRKYADILYPEIVLEFYKTRVQWI